MTTPATKTQIPDSAILDINGKQAYLGNQFVGATDVLTISDTTEDTILFLSCPAGSAKSIFCYVRKLNGGDSNNSVTFRLYANPTGVSAGTAITPINCRFASAITSIATCTKQPTISTKGTFIAAFPIQYAYFQNQSDVLLILDPGQSLLVTVKASGQPTTATAELVWWEI